MQCQYFDAGRCRSCGWLASPYAAQLADKERHCRELMAGYPGLEWLPPVASPEQGFRNKAKMAVGGSADEPTLGILDGQGAGVDLAGCPLYPPALQAAFAPLADFIRRARLPPYDITQRRGELKYLLITLAGHSGELMVRFVLRSTGALPRLRKHLPSLLAALPQLRVASANLQPLPAAVLEGPEEIALTDTQSLTMCVDGVPLHLRPQGFFQTNDTIAAALYRQARAWAAQIRPTALWDLYCGVGGFALHCAAHAGSVTGVESSAEAVASATRSADELGLAQARFVCADATRWVRGAGAAPALVVVNPPRRGIGAELAGLLQASTTGHVIYSSCNAASLARDLAAMPDLRPVQARVLDMFPHTPHYELIVLLRRGTQPGASTGPGGNGR